MRNIPDYDRWNSKDYEQSHSISGDEIQHYSDHDIRPYLVIVPHFVQIVKDVIRQSVAMTLLCWNSHKVSSFDKGTVLWYKADCGSHIIERLVLAEIICRVL